MPARHIQDTGTLSLRASEWWVSGWSCLLLCRIHTAVFIWSSEPQAAVFLFTPLLCQYINKSVALCHFQRSLDWILTATNWSRTCPATWCNYWKSVWRQIIATMQNKLAFLLIWNVCFKDRYQVCDHLLLVAAFKVTLMHQDSNKIARNWSQFQFAGQFGNYVESIYDNMTINCD